MTGERIAKIAKKVFEELERNNKYYGVFYQLRMEEHDVIDVKFKLVCGSDQEDIRGYKSDDFESIPCLVGPVDEDGCITLTESHIVAMLRHIAEKNKLYQGNCEYRTIIPSRLASFITNHGRMLLVPNDDD